MDVYGVLAGVTIIVMVLGYVVAVLHHHKGLKFDAGSFFSGFGTLILACAAVVAAAKADDVLTRLASVQRTSDQIKNVVEKLNLEVLELRKERARIVIDRFALSSNFDSSTSKPIVIRKTLQKLEQSLGAIDGVIFTDKKIEEVLSKWQKDSDLNDKKSMIFNSLEFKK